MAARFKAGCFTRPAPSWLLGVAEMQKGAMALDSI